MTMAIFRACREWHEAILEALFPLSPIERWFEGASTQDIIDSLPRAKQAPVPEACSVFAYKDDRVRSLVWSIKYKRSARCALIAAQAIHRFIGIYRPLLAHIIIVPMPISRQRRRERGFNQCELITQALKEIERSHAYPPDRCAFVDDLLMRERHTSRQTLKDRSGRLDAAHGLFSVDAKSAARLSTATEHSTVFIIDDVVTTGSTMKDAVRALRRAGFRRAWGISIAH
jgi:predicted amidophosphoribosyltransferase